MGFLYYVQKFWPFSVFKVDDLSLSDGIVRKLTVPENTKRFVYAVREPESGSLIYILCAQNLSQRSAVDAECLIREINPDAVVVQVGLNALSEVQLEETEFMNDEDDPVPTSAFEVLKRCLVQKINKDKYENVAGNLVLKEIFGISFHGHVLAAKRVAEEVGSSFLFLESPFMKSIVESNSSEEEPDSGNNFQALKLQPNSLVPQKMGSMVPSSSRRLFLKDDVHLQAMKSLSSYLTNTNSGSGVIQPREDYEAPQFAHSVYPLLVDLHDAFLDIPSIGNGLAYAQKMLYDVNRGEAVDSQLLSEVYIFRIAVEGLRIALNNGGRVPINKLRDSELGKTKFTELSVEDKSHALLAQALRSQAMKFKSIVAIVDASGLAGLRKHWDTRLPGEVKDMVEQLVTNCSNDISVEKNQLDRQRLLADNPMVAVGAGATAILGASSLSKVVPASTYVKIIPTSIKIIMSQTQKAVAIALGKTIGPSKALKMTASAEKFRAVAHGIIASAEKTSLSAMRTAFYEIMRKRQVRSAGVLPWTTFGCSVATCAGLVLYGDGIECAAESLPVAPSIASLGRGIQRLQQASEAVRQEESSRIQRSIESLLYRFKKIKDQ